MYNKLLLIEDESSVLGSYRDFLEEVRGVQWVKAGTHEEACTRAAENHDIKGILICSKGLPAESVNHLILSVQALVGDVPVIFISDTRGESASPGTTTIDSQNSYWGDMLMEKLEDLALI